MALPVALIPCVLSLSLSLQQTLAPPMQSILSRLQHYDHIKIVVFSDDTILKKPVNDWPICDCLLAFFSEGFPLQKAVDYVGLRRPFVFNDLNIQFRLQDRSATTTTPSTLSRDNVKSNSLRESPLFLLFAVNSL